MKNIQISLITLTKNDNLKFLKTTLSIISQIRSFEIEWLIIDGSNKIQYKKNKNLIKKYLVKIDKIYIQHINSKKENIEGIFPCMNYAKSISNGKFIIFLNSGDTFFDNNSLNIYFKNSIKATNNRSLIFGQAKIIANKNISWYFPGKRLKNVKKWIKYFEPNHQTMLIENKLANQFNFPIKYNIISDGYWKRKILDNAEEVIYIKTPLVNFFLDGVSSSKPSKKILKELISNNNISFLRKCIFIIKYLFPPKLFNLYFLLQKYKSILFDFLL